MSLKSTVYNLIYISIALVISRTVIVRLNLFDLAPLVYLLFMSGIIPLQALTFGWDEIKKIYSLPAKTGELPQPDEHGMLIINQKDIPELRTSSLLINVNNLVPDNTLSLGRWYIYRFNLGLVVYRDRLTQRWYYRLII